MTKPAELGKKLCVASPSSLFDFSAEKNPNLELNCFDSFDSPLCHEIEDDLVSLYSLGRQIYNPYDFTFFSRSCRTIFDININLLESSERAGLGDWKKLFLLGERRTEIFSHENPLNSISAPKSPPDLGGISRKIEKRFPWIEGVRFMLSSHIPCNLSPLGYGIKINCKNR